ncbi:hypothetical protein QPX19_03035 [Corynebacterium pseudodiphtheriticum]|nr:hypothetical protein [Corynebacterium pseudodiphtheriticum]MDK4240653.1 hypothetical protein [Corynebacterium pseudodiphtheriticum]
MHWIELDSTLIVRSLGSFPTAITSYSVLSNRAARYSASADLYQALGLVDKRSDGVDRMYQAMIALGHRPPMVEEIAAPFVETTRVGAVGVRIGFVVSCGSTLVAGRGATDWWNKPPAIPPRNPQLRDSLLD